MNRYHQIRLEREAANAEFDRRVKELQDNCPHPNAGLRWLNCRPGFEAHVCTECYAQIEVRPEAPEKYGFHCRTA